MPLRLLAVPEARCSQMLRGSAARPSWARITAAGSTIWDIHFIGSRPARLFDTQWLQTKHPCFDSRATALTFSRRTYRGAVKLQGRASRLPVRISRMLPQRQVFDWQFQLTPAFSRLKYEDDARSGSTGVRSLSDYHRSGPRRNSKWIGCAAGDGGGRHAGG